MLIMLAFILMDGVMPEASTASTVGAVFIVWRAADIAISWVAESFWPQE